MALNFRVVENGGPGFKVVVRPAQLAKFAPVVENATPAGDGVPAPQNNNGDKIESPRDLQAALDSGKEFTPAELALLLNQVHLAIPPEEKKSMTEFERVPGLMCDSSTKKYYLSDHSLISGDMSYDTVEQRILILREIIKLKKIGFTRNMIVKNPRNMGGVCRRCDTGDVPVIKVGNRALCKTCAGQVVPGYDKETFILVGGDAFGKDDQGQDVKCQICLSSKPFYSVPNACGCIVGRKPYCEECYLAWCETKFGVRHNKDEEDQGFHEFDGQVLIPCPFCNQMFIPF